MERRPFVLLMPGVLALYMPFCTPEVRPTVTPADAPRASLWERPTDLAGLDLFHGPWGLEHAPDPADRYTLVQVKHNGVNPGMTVRDSRGRQWSVKQAPVDGPNEGPVEVVLSRVLSAVGYHQPPVYYLRAFTLVDDWGTHTEPGGRFRLKHDNLKDRGSWSWQQNPYVETRPYRGLLVILLMFNSSDLKNSNNTLYEHRSDQGLEHWYVVRDIGTALGGTGRFAPTKNDPAVFERQGFIKSVRAGLVEFEYHGWHQEIIRGRITSDDVAWASDLLSSLSDRQWQDAFAAGGYPPQVAARFITTLQAKIAEGRRVRGASAAPAERVTTR